MTDTPSTSSDREKRAKKIINNPADFKVCEGCESIVTAQVSTCPSCNAYRFDTTPEVIQEHARILASRERRTVIDEDFL